MCVGPNFLVPDQALPYKARAFPKTCDICTSRFKERYGLGLHVQHADLIPGLVGFRIFQAMPKKVRFKAICAGLRGKGGRVCLCHCDHCCPVSLPACPAANRPR